MCPTEAPEAAGAQARGGPDRQLLAGVGALARDLALASTRADVLSALCARISTMVTAPTAYVALNQVRAAEAVVCSTHGIQTAPFRTLRLPHGVGLGGAVAQDGRARATEDYAADRELVHAVLLDRRVGDEGLRGILAVPLRVNGALVGVAMAGTRDARRFGATEAAAAQALCEVVGAGLAHLERNLELRRAMEQLEQRLRELEETNRRQSKLLMAHDPETALRQGERLAAALARRGRGATAGPEEMGSAVLDQALPFLACALLPAAGVSASLQAAWPTVVADLGGFGAAVGSGGDNARLVAFLPGWVPGTVSELHRRLTELSGGPVTAGWAPAAFGVPALRDAIHAAGRTVRLLLALGRPGVSACTEDLGPLAVLAAGAEPGEIAALIDRLLAPVLALDPERRDRLLATLRAWLERGGSIKSVARELDVHVNTVYARMEQIDELLGPAWRTGSRRLEMETVVRLQSLGTGAGPLNSGR